METLGFRMSFLWSGTMYVLADTGQEKTKVVSRLTWLLVGTMRAVSGLARPRQIAMAPAKESTEHSLPEIGEAFGGEDHTTVMHARKKIHSLCDTVCEEPIDAPER